jgi:hypothetical protein
VVANYSRSIRFFRPTPCRLSPGREISTISTQQRSAVTALFITRYHHLRREFGSKSRRTAIFDAIDSSVGLLTLRPARFCPQIARPPQSRHVTASVASPFAGLAVIPRDRRLARKRAPAAIAGGALQRQQYRNILEGPSHDQPLECVRETSRIAGDSFA